MHKTSAVGVEGALPGGASRRASRRKGRPGAAGLPLRREVTQI